MALENEKEVQQLKNRFMDLANKSFRQNCFTFTGFLGLTEQSVFHQMEKELSFAGFSLEGGNELCERKVVRFGKAEELGYEEVFPIVCIRMHPLVKKFSEELGHRDYLGAILNLGIKREAIGDILPKENEAFLFCLETIAPFIMENLDKIKHTHVACEIFEEDTDYTKQEGQLEDYTVSSLRLDVVMAAAYRVSRTKCLELFESTPIYLNGKQCENNSQVLKPGDVVNVRGKGKFVFKEIKYVTKKDKMCIEIEAYR